MLCSNRCSTPSPRLESSVPIIQPQPDVSCVRETFTSLPTWNCQGFICKHCGAAANNNENLIKPINKHTPVYRKAASAKYCTEYHSYTSPTKKQSKKVPEVKTADCETDQLADCENITVALKYEGMGHSQGDIVNHSAQVQELNSKVLYLQYLREKSLLSEESSQKSISVHSVNSGDGKVATQQCILDQNPRSSGGNLTNQQGHFNSDKADLLKSRKPGLPAIQAMQTPATAQCKEADRVTQKTKDCKPTKQQSKHRPNTAVCKLSTEQHVLVDGSGACERPREPTSEKTYQISNSTDNDEADNHPQITARNSNNDKQTKQLSKKRPKTAVSMPSVEKAVNSDDDHRVPEKPTRHASDKLEKASTKVPTNGMIEWTADKVLRPKSVTEKSKMSTCKGKRPKSVPAEGLREHRQTVSVAETQLSSSSTDAQETKKGATALPPQNLMKNTSSSVFRPSPSDFPRSSSMSQVDDGDCDISTFTPMKIPSPPQCRHSTPSSRNHSTSKVTHDSTDVPTDENHSVGLHSSAPTGSQVRPNTAKVAPLPPINEQPGATTPPQHSAAASERRLKRTEPPPLKTW